MAFTINNNNELSKHALEKLKELTNKSTYKQAIYAGINLLLENYVEDKKRIELLRNENKLLKEKNTEIKEAVKTYIEVKDYISEIIK